MNKITHLPRKFNSICGEYIRGEYDPKKEYEKLGIKVIKESVGDELFFDVELPEGWEIEPTDHLLWSNLLNDKKEVVASICYKAASYDRDAFINIKKI